MINSTVRFNQTHYRTALVAGNKKVILMRLSLSRATEHMGQQLDASSPVRPVSYDVLCILPSDVDLIQVLL